MSSRSVWISRRHLTRSRLVLAFLAVCAILLGAFPAVTAKAVPGGGERADGRSSKGRGVLVSAERLYTLPTVEEVSAGLEKQDFGTGQVRYGVDGYRLVYRTVDVQGRVTTASGLLTLPHDRPGALTPVTYGHGSELLRSDAPSTDPQGFDGTAALGYAAAGFATLAPDYLGMGKGPGSHPYLHVRSGTDTTLDMLRAAEDFLPGENRSLRGKVLATGFSQGAGVALGLGRALQAGEGGRFQLGAVAAVSGAYDLRRAQIPAMLDGKVAAKAATVSSAYTLASFNRLHEVYDKPDEVFRPPYASKIDELTDGTHSYEELAQGTPETLEELLTPHGLGLLREPEGPMAEALEDTDNACTGWRPRASTRLYFAGGDEQSATTNTASCVRSLEGQGAKVEVHDLAGEVAGPSVHFASQIAAQPHITEWFSAASRR
ncbi:lipase [Streptomyces sp. NPDC005438]|uniref:alpha/beta hydrolase family protein n=1 Tax=Streptomyces sp. NPDC005438 TaxID=3156880 RepID=UPI0033B63165